MSKDRLRLVHIFASIRKIEDITAGMDIQDFLNDWKSQDIVVRNLEIIGEASSHISYEIMEQFPEVEWQSAKSLRNFLIHQYFDVNYDEVWATVQKDLPEFKLHIERIMNSIEN